MNEQTRSIALVVAGLAFVAFLVAKLLVRPGARGPLRWRGRRRIAEATLRARERSLPPGERAAALREAASIALEIGRPGLAASYARRAERLEPGNLETLGLVAIALRRASRFRALERMLWRHLAEVQVEPDSARYQRALHELIELYAGPLKRIEIAGALRRMTRPPG